MGFLTLPKSIAELIILSVDSLFYFCLDFRQRIILRLRVAALAEQGGLPIAIGIRRTFDDRSVRFEMTH